MRTLNLGILAHVDAGKTSLTERLLYAAGVIDEIGSVDDGSTQTDTLALERQRGITIRSAVASFVVDDVAINLIDTPGHPDFIAEVERVLNVLDGAVLVVSAVEGVQAQTRVLMRTLRRLRIPTLIFVNKIDRVGAQYENLLQSMSEKLAPATPALGTVDGLGTRDATFTPISPATPTPSPDWRRRWPTTTTTCWPRTSTTRRRIRFDPLRAELAAQTQRMLVHPVYFGSAITGAGVDSLTAGITELLPATQRDEDGPVSGAVFKIERGSAGEKIAYVSLSSGTIRTRERLHLGDGRDGKVTAIRVFDRGAVVQHASVAAGQIGKLWGLESCQVGDVVGRAQSAAAHSFAPPTLETVVVPRHPAERGALHVALGQLAEQDPLINLRQDEVRQEVSVSLYGEVQKEVIEATLATDFGLDVTFRETTTICIERPTGTGAAVEVMGKHPNPFLATVGLRVDPAPVGVGRDVRAGGRARCDAVLVLQGGRGHGARHAEPGTARLAGHGLRGDHDPLRLRAAAEPRARDLRQEHVEHRRGLPWPDAAGADGRADGGGHDDVRADAPLRPGAAGRVARPRAARAVAAARRTAGVGDGGRHLSRTW